MVTSIQSHLICFSGSRISLQVCRWIKYSSYNSNRNISLTAKKDVFISIKSLHIKCRSVNCVWIRQSLKQLSKYLSRAILKNICPKKFLEIIKTSVAAFIFYKILCFQHIVLNIFRGCV